MMNTSSPVDIETELLRAFVTVVDTGGFTRAARALNRTQSAVSMQIRRLEERTGRRRLFERNGRSVSLTREGEALVGYARRILLLNDEALQAVSRHAVEGTVRLGVIDDYATVVLPPILVSFAAKHPGVYVELQTGLTVHLLERLGARFDVVLGRQPKGQSGGGEPLRREPAVWAGTRPHAAHERNPLPLALTYVMSSGLVAVECNPRWHSGAATHPRP